MYTNPFYLTENTGNNAFAFSARKNPRLFIPRLVKGTVFNAKEGNEIAFADTDEKGNIVEKTGLQHFIKADLT